MKRTSKFFCYLLLALWGIPQLHVSAQHNNLDSLEKAFYSTTPDSLKWEAAQTLSDEWAFIQTDTAFNWAQRSFDLAQKIQNSSLIARSLYQLGAASYDKLDLPLAMDYFLKAHAQFQEQGDDRLRVDTELEIGLIYQGMEEFDKARKYLDQFYHYYLERGAPEAPSIIFALNQYVVLFEKMGQVDSMLHYSRATLAAAQRYKQNKYLANIHNNLASVYLYALDFNKAKFHFQEAERIGFGPNKIGRYYNFYALADMYRSLEQGDSSVFFCRKAIAVTQSFGDVEKEAQIHQFLAELYQREEKFELAFSHLDTFLILSDSVSSMRYEQDLSELSVKYETQEKEAQIARQTLQLQQEANRRNNLLFGSLAALLLLVGLFLYLRNRQQIRTREAHLKLQYQETEAKRLRELDQLKSNFFANISHEFRTPLTLILGPLRQMKEGTFKEDKASYLKHMIGQGERLLSLVNQMLDLSRLESGHMERQDQAGELTQFVRTTISFFESWADQKNIHLVPSLPQKQIPTQFDADKLEKILSNLLANALKFTPEGGEVILKLEEVDESDKQRTIQFEISDNGRGIPTDQLSHIFQRFYQSNASNNRSDIGSGIGLALTKELVTFLGGSIEASSQLGQGAIFTVILPFAKADLSKASAARLTKQLMPPEPINTPRDQNAPTKQDGPLILIAEDNADLRRYIRDQLRQQYNLLEAENGRQGLELAKTHLPDLVISDVRMPEMDGLEFSTSLKTDEHTSHIPLILLTALAEQQNIRSGLSTGADAYLTKPFDAEELNIRVHHLIEQRRKLRKKYAQALSEGSKVPTLANPTDAAFLDKIRQAVFDHLDNEAFNIERLGREIGMSRSQLHRKTKALTDQSPSVFVRTIRLQHAYELLSQKKGNVSEIAHEVGIPNLAQFSRSFKAQFGIPPSQV